MKVLILSESSRPSRYWEGALPLLRTKGIDASFATIHAPGEIHLRLRETNIETFALGSISSIHYPLAVYRLARILAQNEIDIVHASEAIQATVAGIACVFTKRTKCVYHCHHTRTKGVQKALSRVGALFSNCVMAVSKASRDAAIRLDGMPSERVMIAHNGIEPLRSVGSGEIADLRARLGVASEAKVISIVGRLQAGKGHRTLFQASEIIAEEIAEDLHLIVVGEGFERPTLEMESERLKGVKVHFVGNQDDVALWYSAADVVAVPSYTESFGLVAVEAMVCAKPLVASNIEGLAEIVEDGVNGLLFPPGNAAELANAILRLIRSPEYSRELGENAKRTVLDRFTLERMVDGWIDCYRRILGR